MTDGHSIRRRAAMWRWLLSVAIAAVLLVALVVVVLRLDGDRSAGAVAAAVVTAVLAAAAVVVTWLESRRITAHLNRTIERLIDTESELRLLLDDLPEAVLSVDDDGVVRGANAKAAELAGRPVAELTGQSVRGPRRAGSRYRPGPVAGGRARWPGAGCRHRPPPARRRVDEHARRGDGRPPAQRRCGCHRPPPRRHRARGAGARPRAGAATVPAGVPLGADRDGARAPRRLDDPRRQPLARRDARPARRRPRRAHASARSPTPRTCAPRPPTGRGSSWASPTPTCSTSATCAATASSCGRAPASPSPRTRALHLQSPTSRTSPSSGARPSGCSGRRRTTTSPVCRTAPS